LVMMPAYPKTGGDPAVDPFYIFYLADVDPATALGTLFVQRPDRTAVKIGAKSALEHVVILPSADETRGYALLDVAAGLGRFVRFHPDGSTDELAKGVVRGIDDVLADYNGKGADLVLPQDDHVMLVAHGVPPGRFK